MNMRIRRLQADYKETRSLFANHPYIRLIAAKGTPPDKYTFEIRLKGLVSGNDGVFCARNVHRTEVFLPLDYPRRPPFCRMTTPVFHPNIDPQKICIGDHWSAGQSLAQLVVRIAEMVCYQSYNTKSPLNAKAATWALENSSHLPLQAVDLTAGV